MVRDREHVGNQIVGTCLISTEERVSGQPVEGWYDIMVGVGGKKKGSIHIMLQFFPVWSCGDDSNYLVDAYFQPKTDNQVALYMMADSPQLPVFDGVTEPDGSPYQDTRCWLDIYKSICNAEKLIYVTGWSVYTQIDLGECFLIPQPGEC